MKTLFIKDYSIIKEYHLKISIITVTYNAESILEGTILNIINQTYKNTELIIIDGGSTDDTLSIISKYESHIDYWISEPDEGIFHAMNKGIAAASGTWINFMNAGDAFHSIKVLEQIDFSSLDDQNVAIVYGSTNDIGKGIRPPRDLSVIKTGGIPACHQSMFFNTRLLKSDIYFAPKFLNKARYGDLELVARIFSKGYKFHNAKICISDFAPAGSSANSDIITGLMKYQYIAKIFGPKYLLQALKSYFIFKYSL